MKHRIITISREFGSGGRTIGKQAAERLGLSCYDHELIDRMAEESGFAQDYLWSVQRRVILDLAGQGPCVIVGRCADYILREEAQCLKVFIHADLDKRADRIVRLYGQREEAPVKRLKDKDKRRASYYKFYTDLDWGDVRNYHLALDSGVLGIDTCVDIIVNTYRQMSSGT